MFSTKTLAVALFIAAAGLSTGHAHAQSAFGDNTTISTHGSVQTAVALALGASAAAHNVVGGFTAFNDVTTGKNFNLTANGTAQTVVALALGAAAHASNNIGGVLLGH